MKAMMTYILEQPAMFGKMLADRAGIAAPFAEALQKAQLTGIAAVPLFCHKDIKQKRQLTIQ